MGWKTQSDRSKFYLVGVLAVVMAVMAYFRFFHKSSPAAPRAGQTTAAADLYTIPALPEWMRNRSAVAPAGPQPYAPPRRDIFAPVAAATTTKTDPGHEEPVAQPRPQLSGIMQTAQESRAVIDGKVVRTGERIGKYTVSAIGLREVVLTSSTNRLVLTVGE